MMYTFLFTFINPNTGKEDQTEYCAETDKEAVEGFQDFCSDEGFDTVPDYDMEIIYNHDDADYYGMDYGYPDEYPNKECSTCIYCSQEEKGNSFYCLNQSSRKFGKKMSLVDTKKFCKDQTEHYEENNQEVIEGFFCSTKKSDNVEDDCMDCGEPDERTDTMCNTCIFCSYEEEKEGLYCHHQKSENYGKKLSLADAKKFCKDHCPHNYEISLKEALRQTISPESYNDVYYHRILPSGKDAKAYAIIEFSSNEELERWKDGHVRLFKEYVDLRVSDGEIQVAHTEEQDND